VGLKRCDNSFPRAQWPFSRTPRGFEAVRQGVQMRLQRPLSAEPLVGLKHHGSRHTPHHDTPFSRTPRGFEAL